MTPPLLLFVRYPWPHVMQSYAVLGLAELYFPLGQSVHSEAVLEGAYLPAPQVEQVASAAFWLLYFPLVQAMHWVAPLLLVELRCMNDGVFGMVRGCVLWTFFVVDGRRELVWRYRRLYLICSDDDEDDEDEDEEDKYDSEVTLRRAAREKLVGAMERP